MERTADIRVSDVDFTWNAPRTRMEYSHAEVIRLMAEDLRTARASLGITSHQAARRAGVSASNYRALEKGLVPNTDHVLRKLVSVCRRLGMETFRVAYEDLTEQYVKLDLSSDPTIAFVDTVQANIAGLHNLRCFISPDTVFSFFERTDFPATLASSEPEDKRMAELLSASVLSMCLDGTKDYYVRPAKNDPPDVELQGVERDGSFGPVSAVEITHHGKYSKSLYEVIGKKLAKRYQRGTMLVVMVEGAETIEVEELDAFIRNHNFHGQQLVLIGGTAPGKFLALPWDHVSSPSPGEVDWREIKVDQTDRGTGFRGYRGVFSEPTLRWRARLPPIFVKEVTLTR